MLTVGSMFSGVGLLDYGLHLAGLRHVWFAERDEFRRGILARRWPGAVVLDDVRAVGADAVPRVDVIAGGFPCKGNSSAGKRNGLEHPETVLWHEMARAVRELRPRYVLVENVRDALSVRDGAVWSTVLGDLATLGFDVEWDCLPAAAFGAPHRRDRVFAVAWHPDRARADALAEAGGQRTPVGERHIRAAAYATGHPAGAGESTRRSGRGRTIVAGSPPAAADPAWDAEGRAGAQSGPVRERAGKGVDARCAVVADADGGGLEELEERDCEQRARLDGTSGHDAQRRCIQVEWGDYGAAIRRWEAVRGAAPEPLVRRVDDGRARRVERSRLSALGDGVLVQAGELCGRWIVSHAAESAKAAA